VQAVAGLLITRNSSNLSWLWPDGAVLPEKVGGKVSLADLDIRPPKIIKTPCRVVEKSSWFYFPSHFAFFFLLPASLSKRNLAKLQCSF